MTSTAVTPLLLTRYGSTRRSALIASEFKIPLRSVATPARRESLASSAHSLGCLAPLQPKSLDEVAQSVIEFTPRERGPPRVVSLAWPFEVTLALAPSPFSNLEESRSPRGEGTLGV